MMQLRMDLRGISAAVLALAACLSTGCAMFSPKAKTDLAAEVQPNGVEDGKVEAPPGQFTVEVRPVKGQPIAKQQPLAGPLTVQEALEHTKANKKFKRFKLELHRPLPDGRIHAMVLEYDRTVKHVDPEYDYSIQPGDKVIVVEDTKTMFDDFMERLAEPFGGTARFAGKDKERGARSRFEG
jgi:hypothetical protein